VEVPIQEFFFLKKKQTAFNDYHLKLYRWLLTTADPNFEEESSTIADNFRRTNRMSGSQAMTYSKSRLQNSTAIEIQSAMIVIHAASMRM